jgi:SulP family sulfate permease
MNIKQYLPFLEWVPNYNKSLLTSDAIAGLTTAMMLIPQAMAYAVLAGLKPEVGLYASIVPVLLYSLFGTSRQLAVGPVAMVSLLVAVGVGPLAQGNYQHYLMFAVILALMVGVMQLVMGLAKLGFLTNFLSHPVISGFTSAAALIIAFSQLKHILGFKIPRSHHIHTIIGNALSNINQTHLITLGIGLLSVVILVVLKSKFPRVPRALVVVVLSTVAVWAFGLDKMGVKILKTVPAGIPAPSLPSFSVLYGANGALNWGVFQKLLNIALIISLVGFMESVSVAKAFARKHRYDIKPNQELIGLGIANLGGSVFGAYPVTGGFSRTAVNDGAGAKTPMAPIFTAVTIALTLLFFTPWLYFLPLSALAAIIFVAVFGLIDLHEVKHLWHVKRSDLIALVVTFFSTLSLGIEMGILMGVGLSLAMFIWRTTQPHTAVLGQLPQTRVFRNVKNFPEAETFNGLLLLRVDAQFYFGNVTFLKDLLKTQLAQATAPIRGIVIEAGSINQLDSSADSALHEIAEELKEEGIFLYFANVKGPVMEVMKLSGFDSLLGESHFFYDMNDAVEQALHQLQASSADPQSSKGEGNDSTSANTARRNSDDQAGNKRIQDSGGHVGHGTGSLGTA